MLCERTRMPQHVERACSLQARESQDPRARVNTRPHAYVAEVLPIARAEIGHVAKGRGTRGLCRLSQSDAARVAGQKREEDGEEIVVIHRDDLVVLPME